MSIEKLDGYLQCLNDLMRYIKKNNLSTEQLENGFVIPQIKEKEYDLNNIMDEMYKAYHPK